MRSLWIVIIPLIFTQACNRECDELDAGQERAVISSVDTALRSFESAQRELNADAAIALLSPEFFMYSDGERQGYDSIARNIRQTFETFEYLEPGFRDINIRPLSKTMAITSFRFQDSLVVRGGGMMRFKGATTLLWEYRDGRWLMTYGHADHRQVE